MLHRASTMTSEKCEPVYFMYAVHGCMDLRCMIAREIAWHDSNMFPIFIGILDFSFHFLETSKILLFIGIRIKVKEIVM